MRDSLGIPSMAEGFGDRLFDKAVGPLAQWVAAPADASGDMGLACGTLGSVTDYDSQQLEALNPGRSWHDYSENDIQHAAYQHGGTCLNARQALVLDVLCACEGMWSKIPQHASTTGEMPISELARLTNMSLLELVPEVVDMVTRSPINKPPDVDQYERGEKPAVVQGELRLVAQVQVIVRAENDPHPGDREHIFEQENGGWSPPSMDVPRVLGVGYWVDWELLDEQCEDDEARERLEEMIEQLRQAAAARAGI